MRFFQNLFGKKPDRNLPFKVGDKVRDLWGQTLVVTEIDPDCDHGLGMVRTRNAAGVENSMALATHNLTLVEKDTPLASDFSVRRIHPEDFKAGAYLRPNMIVLHGICQTNSGGFNCEPYRNFETNISDSDLGTALLQVLKEAGTAPVPENLKIEQQKIFNVCKVRSWSKLCEGTVHCSITQTPTQFSFLPTERDGRGFNHLPNLTIQISAPNVPEQIGNTLRNCFQICK